MISLGAGIHGGMYNPPDLDARHAALAAKAVDGTITQAELDEAQAMVMDEAAKKMETLSFDDEYPTYFSLVDGVRNGELLVHARELGEGEGEDLQYGLHPTIGETLEETEALQTIREWDIEPAPLVFASDGFKWAGQGRNGLVFVRKDGFQKSLGNNKVQLSDGTIVSYERSPIADHENEALREEPAGVETGDWYSIKTADVVGVFSFNEKSSDPFTFDDDGNLIPLSERFQADSPDIRHNPPRRRARNSSSWDFVRVLERQADLWKPFARQNNLPMPITKNVVGCGFFGCIFETTMPGVGLKITRAYDEASFFAWQQSAQTVGIVPVHAVAGLPGLTEYYLIWRDLLDDCCEGAVYSLWQRMINKGHLNPDFGKVLLKQRMDTSLEEQMANGIELVEHYEGMNDIGHTLIDAAESGYVIFDLHPNNLGRWLDYDQLIIFDAGFQVKNEIYPEIYYLVKGEDGVELITYREWDERDRMARKI
jgi:hypothetical protein